MNIEDQELGAESPAVIGKRVTMDGGESTIVPRDKDLEINLRASQTLNESTIKGNEDSRSMQDAKSPLTGRHHRRRK